MTAEEILLSESQERMLLVIRPEKAEEIISIFKKWDLEAEIIGEVIEEEKFIVYFKGEKVVDLPTELLVDGSLIFDPPYKEYKVPNLSSDLRSLIKKEHIEKFMNNAINDLSLKEKIYRQYDYSVQTNTVLPPGFGDASVLRIKGTNKGIAVVTDGNGRYCYLNPKRGAMYAVAEACRNILCVGGRPLAITDGLNFGDPDEPEVFYQFREVVKGINLASRTLEIPVVSGNVSFYNGQGEKKIFPTPIIGMVGVLEDLSYLIKPGLKVVGNRLYLIGDFSWLSLEGSRFIKDVFDKIEGEAPYVDLIWERKLKLFMEEIRKERDIIVSAHDVSEGGILVALLEMAFWGNKGVEVSLPSEKLDNLVGEGSGLIIVEVNKDREDEYMEFIKKYELKTHKMGEVVEKDFIIEPFIKEDINEFYQRR